MESKNNEKKIIFSESIDNSINGFAVVVTFIGTGIFMIYHRDYLGNSIVSKIIQWTFIVIGILGLCVEVSNLMKNKKQNQIQGITDLFLGITFLIVWLLMYTNLNVWYMNIISFAFLVLGLYGTSRGSLEVIYSFINLNKNGKKAITWSLVKDIILVISEILAAIVAIINILQATNLIQYFIN